MGSGGNNLKDLTGKTFGRLTVVKFHGIEKSNCYWMCDCLCGGSTISKSAYLSNGTIKSCGCLMKENARKHGFCNTVEYQTWLRMKSRCSNPKNSSYVDYGGRGIIICERWLNKETGFINFISDMGMRPSNIHSLDRINVNGNYEPSNCRWATPKQQSSNRRTSRILEHNGESKVLNEWASIFNVTHSGLFRYLKTHTFEQAYNFYMSKLPM